MDLSARIEIGERSASVHSSSDIFVVRGTTGTDTSSTRMSVLNVLDAIG